MTSLLMTASVLVSDGKAIRQGEPLQLVPRNCPSQGALQVRQTPDAALLLRPQDRRGRDGAQSLASLPPADQHLTVLRSVDGCAVSTVVRENVSGDGRFARGR